jgi:protein-disulfide isomerase
MLQHRLQGGPMRKIWIFAALLALILPGLGVAGAKSPGPLQTAEATDAVYPDDLYLGKADAKLTIIEYASLSCPHCAKFNKDVLPKIKEAYIDKGLVRWIYRDYPLNRPAFQASILAHCTSPIRFFSLLDTLFQSQDYWVSQAQPLSALKQIGASVGIDEKSYEACLADEALKKKILERAQDADTRYKVNSTPTFVIKGTAHAGEMSYEEFKKLIDEALGQS